MIYSFLLALLPVSPFLAIMAVVGFYIFAKNHMKDDGSKRSDSGGVHSDEWEPYNRFAINSDVNDFVNGPYSK